MPVEGQARAPLTRRDKRLIGALAALLAAGAIAAGVLVATRPAHTSAGCVVVTFPSTVGGGILRRCGAAARALCATQAKTDRAIAAACKRAKIGSASRRRR